MPGEPDKTSVFKAQLFMVKTGGFRVKLYIKHINQSRGGFQVELHKLKKSGNLTLICLNSNQ